METAVGIGRHIPTQPISHEEYLAQQKLKAEMKRAVFNDTLKLLDNLDEWERVHVVRALLVFINGTTN